MKDDNLNQCHIFTDEELTMSEEEVDKELLKDYGSEEEVRKALDAFRDGI